MFNRYQFAILVALLFMSNSLFSGTVGKIAGSVIDAESGDPLAGANVLVVGSSLGAAADLNGNYTILQVPPGIYDVQVSVIGYATIKVSMVRVRIDQTARVDFSMKMEALEGEAVTVIANRNIVKEDVATSVVAFSGDDVEELPLSTIEEAVELQAGVEDGMVIRGGGADESLLLIDGITMRDPRNNQPIAGIALSAVKELSIERGGFNAEYGQVRSGVVNIVTKEGSKTGYHGSMTMKYSPPAAKHFGISPFDMESMWIKAYVDEAVCWEGTKSGAWDMYTYRQYPDFKGWRQVSAELNANDDPSDDLSPAACRELFLWEHRKGPVTDQPDYNIDAGFGGPVPFIGEKLGNLRFFSSYQRQREMLLVPLSRDDYLDYNWSTQLTSDISETMKLRMTGLAGKNYNVVINDDDQRYYGTEFGPSGVSDWYPTQFIRTPVQIAKMTDEQRPGRIFSNAWYSNADVSYLSLAGKLTHMLNSETFYEVSLEHLTRKYQTGPVANRDTAKVNEVLPGYFMDEFPYGFVVLGESGVGNSFFVGGHMAEARDSSRISATTFKFDITSQLNFSNLLKAGVEFVYNDLNLNYGQINGATGKVILVNENQKPYRGAVYVQDKLETKGFIMNAGLRLDFSNANVEWVTIQDAFDRDYLSASNYSSDKDYGAEKTKTDISLSPRLGISHPITENSKLFFNYGHFKQLPSYELLMRVGRNQGGGMINYGNPNVPSAKTVSYELGYDHSLFNNYLVQLAAFYHDITDQGSFTNYSSADGSVTYTSLTNNSYEDIRGFELTLRKTTGHWWSGFMNYTYQVNTSGYFGKQNIFEDPSEQRKYDDDTRNLYQRKPIPQPYARVNLIARTPKDYGPQFLGTMPLGGWTANFIYTWRAGEYIDWNPFKRQDVYDNVQVRGFHDSKLRFSKLFSMGSVHLTTFVEIENLFNLKRLSGASFYDYFDFLYYMESLHLPESEDYNNIVGTDRVGDYRKSSIAYQPIEIVGNVEDVAGPLSRPIYYESNTGRYMQHTDGEWVEVEKGRMNKILKDKAYIDMPNQTSFNFLNPRQWFFGIELSFDLN